MLMSTNLTLPKTQWTPVATNTWSADGNFSLTVTNAVNQSCTEALLHSPGAIMPKTKPPGAVLLCDGLCAMPFHAFWNCAWGVHDTGA